MNIEERSERDKPQLSQPMQPNYQKNEEQICLFDPGVENNQASLSSNLGDLIIREAVVRELNSLFENPSIISISTQERLGGVQKKLISKCDWQFVGGTNLLSSNMLTYRQWKVSIIDRIYFSNAILLGAGWWQYQDNADIYTRLLLRELLSSTYIHSVRDEYTKRKLEFAGIYNVLNTGCPTMWPLLAVDPRDIPCEKSANVLIMLTDYSQNREFDCALIRMLKREYKNVYFWPQGRGDVRYLHSLGIDGIDVLDHTIDALDSLLMSGEEVEYVGTRLHGGIRCLNMRKRSLIICVDNRALELSKDSGLSVVQRWDSAAILKWIRGSTPFSIRLNQAEIQLWKAQFNLHGV
ncbi:MAG: polysaccharide pyruvyl transferase family protein [Methylocella sp.]